VSEAPGLRITLQGEGGAADAWAALLLSPGTEVLRVATLEEARAARPSLAVFFSAPEGAGALAQRVSELQVPFSLIVGDLGDHPHTRLLRDLVQAKRDWQSAFDAMVDPIAVVAVGGGVVRANLALAGALDRPINTVVGVNYRELLGPPEGPLPDLIARGLETASAQTSEGRYAHLPGLRQVTVSPLKDEAGELRGVTVILKDITELRDHQDRVLRSVRLADVGLLAAGVAHEINTPLASIGLRAESLLRSAEDPLLNAVESFKKFPRYLKTIGEEILRCKKIISALLEFGRTRKHEVTQTSVNDLASSAGDLVSHELRIRRLTLELRLEHALPMIRADHGQLRQVLLALLMNAMEATPPGGHIAIETRPIPEGRIALRVRDDGAGIAPEHLERVFSPFFTTKPLGQGTGLGLAVCHGVVASHGGELRIESLLGAGTTVIVELPVEGAMLSEGAIRG
jgi:signal transduction histidine kinase